MRKPMHANSNIRSQAERVPTGISGLDVILNGGFLPRSIYLVEGVPGAGKTTLGLQFIYSGIVDHHKHGLIITFEEFPEQLERDARSFRWDLRALQQEGSLAILSTSPDSLMRMLQEPGGPIDQMASAGQLQRVLVDSITHFQLTSSDSSELRKTVSAFLNGLRRLNATALLTKEIEHDDPTEIPFEEYLVDGVIRLSNMPLGPLRRTRCLEVIKSRGQPHLSGRSVFRFGPAGVEVFPRLSSNWAADAHWLPEAEGALREERGEANMSRSAGVCPPDRTDVPSPADPPRVSTGITGIDQMLHGGMVRGSSGLVAGTSGTGKTLLCLQFLYAGLSAGESAVMLTAEENAQKLMQSAASIGIDLTPFTANGQLHIEGCSPAETTPGEALWKLYRLVRACSATRVVIDSLSALFGEEFARPGVMEIATQHLVNLFETMKITALLTWEIQDITGDLRISDHGLSALMDSLILLRYVEVGSEMRRVIAVMKSRGTDHDNQLREFRITTDGFKVECKLEGISGLLRGSARGEVKETVEELLQPLIYIEDMATMLKRGEVPSAQMESVLDGLAQVASQVSTSIRQRMPPRVPDPGESA